MTAPAGGAGSGIATPARVVLYAAFTLSGAAALFYESIWSRYLGLFLGHSAYAQVLVLTVFLGGMAIGAALTGWRSSALRFPLLWYAGVEVLIGVLGFFFHGAFGAMSAASYDHVFPALRDAPILLAAFKSVAAALLILPQSILLGATFPLMSAGVLRRMPDRASGVLGWLYAWNSLGAAVGVLVAGFFLVGQYGLPGTLKAAAILNLVAALFAGVIHAVGARGQGRTRPGSSDAPTHSRDPSDSSLRTLLLVIAFGTAAASFGYEIAWIRMLSLVLGSATHSFELMLSAFILGLALGALWIGFRGDRIRDPVRALVIVQCVMGAMAAATLPLYVASFGWMVDLLATFTRTAEGYVGFTLARYGICLVIMLPATICAGMTLPLITRILYRSGAHEGAVGEVYGANTAGSIVGVQLAALFLLPVLGLKLLLVGAALTDIVLGALLLPSVGARRGLLRFGIAVPIVAGVLVLMGAWSSPFDQRVMNSGVFRTGRILEPSDWAMMFHSDGRTATVTVRKSVRGHVVLATNGKPDASLSPTWFRPDTLGPKRPMLQSDEETQLLLPLLALAHRPRARSVAVIGYGSGITSHVLLGAPDVREVTTIEIEPEMMRASMAFFPFNRRVFEDPRSRVIFNDARAFFAGAGTRFDLIVSEPSNPWVSGVSGLFTKEFYARVRPQLAPGGVFAQWLNLYEMNDALVRTVLAALQSAFPIYDVYVVGEADIVVIATTADAVAAPDWSVIDSPAIQQDLSHTAVITPETLAALFSASSRQLGPFVKSAKPNSDFEPVLDLEAERARFVGTSAVGFRTLNTVSFDFASVLAGKRLSLSGSLAPAVDVQRLQLRSASARLRSRVPADSVISDLALVAALQRRRTHDAIVSSGRPPVNWQLWANDLALIDREIHIGSGGVIDSALFAPLDGYLRRAGAPSPAQRTVQFLRALDTWDFATAARASEELVFRQQRGETWIPADYLRDGAITAKLMSGDPRGALRLFAAMQRFARPDVAGSFRSQLLMAQILAAFSPPRP